MSIQRRDAVLALQCFVLGAYIAGEWWRWRLKPVVIRNSISHCMVTTQPDREGPIFQFGEPS